MTTAIRSDLVDWLTGKVAMYLNVQRSDVDPDSPLADFGLDSVFALTLAGDLEYEMQILVEPTIAWDYPTINEIANYLATVEASDTQ